MKNIFKKATALLLSLLMVFSVCSTALVVYAAESDETIKYVSLGDSMTNGYGHEGYHGNTGVEDYGVVSYANQFAEYLGAEHAQLAMSAMRAEDLHWLLEVDCDDPAVEAVINTLAETECWDEDLWYSVFTTGDYWTWNELVNDYRFDVAAYCIEGKDKADDGKFNDVENDGYKIAYDTYTDFEALEIVAEYYQESVAAADVLSLAMGNGNFGVFMFGRVTDAIGFGGTPADTKVYNIDNALRECDEATKNLIYTMLEEVELILGNAGIYADDGDDNTYTAIEALYNVFMYTCASYVLNYAGSLDAILRLNPDAEIIQVALMNTMGENDGFISIMKDSLKDFLKDNTLPTDLSLADVLEIAYVPLNTCLAALPTVMKGAMNSVYANAEFYWAEAPYVECIVDTYDSGINGTVRSRFVESIVGTKEDPGMVWGMLADQFGLVPVTLADIEAYETNGLVYAIENPAKASSIAIYLAFEDAVKDVVSNKDIDVTVESIMGLNNLSFDMVGVEYGQNVYNYGIANQEAINEAVLEAFTDKFVKDVNSTLKAKEIDTTISRDLVGQDVKKLLLGEPNNVVSRIRSNLANYLRGVAVDTMIKTLADCLETAENNLEFYDYEIDLTVEGYVEYLISKNWKAGVDTPNSRLILAQRFGADVDNSKYMIMYLRPYICDVLKEASIPYADNEIDNSIVKTYTDEERNEIINTYNQVKATKNFYNGVYEIFGANNYTNYRKNLTNNLVSTYNALTNAGLFTQILANPEALSAALQNPDNGMAGLLSLFARCVIGNGIGSHPSEAGHNALTEALKSAYDNKYTSVEETEKNVKIVIAQAWIMINNYYDEAYAYGYQYAKNNGYVDKAIYAIDKSIVAIDEAIAAVQNAIETDQVTAEFKAEVKVEIAAIKETLAKLKVVLQDDSVATVEGLTKYVFAAQDDIQAHFDNAYAILAQAGVDVNQLLIIPALNEAKQYITDVVIPQAEELIKVVAEQAYDKLVEFLGNSYNELVEIITEATVEYFPIVADEVYNYLYNNPDEVITFVQNVAPYIAEVPVEAGYVVVGALGYVLCTYGEDIATVVIENHEVILSAIVDWVEVNGENTAELLQVYAEALGLCDFVNGEIEKLEDKLADLNAELAKQYQIFESQIKPQLEALYKQLEEAAEPYKQPILDAIAELELQKEVIEKYIAELQGMIEAIIANIDVLELKLQNLVATLYNLDDALKALVEVGIEAGFDGVAQALDAVGAAVIDLIGVVSKDAAAQVDSLIAKAKELLENTYYNATHADYTVSKDSYYVALGDGAYNAEFLAKITEVVKNAGVSFKFDEKDMKDLTDANGIGALSDKIQANVADVAKADLISIGYSFDKIAENTMRIAFERLINGDTTVTTEHNWVALVGPEVAAEVEKALAELRVELNKLGLEKTVAEMLNVSEMEAPDVTIADAVIEAIEYFAYYAVEYAVEMPKAVAAINQINPNALIMVNAISNPIAGAKISFFGNEVVFGDYVDYVCDAIYVETAAIAALNKNVVFVPATQVATTFTNQTISVNSINDFVPLNDYINKLMMNELIKPTEEGNAYVAQKMFEALIIKVERSALLGDVNSDGIVNLDDALAVIEYYLTIPTLIDVAVADVTGEGVINLDDALCIIEYYLEIRDEFPAA